GYLAAIRPPRSITVVDSLEANYPSNETLKKAEGSSLNDAMIVPFALYIDAVEVDKRVFHCVQQRRSRHPLMDRVVARLFCSKGLRDLASKLETMAAKT